MVKEKTRFDFTIKKSNDIINYDKRTEEYYFYKILGEFKTSKVNYCIKFFHRELKGWIFKIGKSTEKEVRNRILTLYRELKKRNIVSSMRIVGIRIGDNEDFYLNYFEKCKFEGIPKDIGGYTEFFIPTKGQEKTLEKHF